jgi:hypothetical protein
MSLIGFLHSVFRPSREVVEHVEKVEKQTIELKHEVDNVKRRLDPLKQLLLDMEQEFKKSDK